MIQAYDWKVVESCSNVEKIADVMEQGSAYLIVIDDSPELSAAEALRTLNSNIVACASPVLCLMQADQVEYRTLVEGFGRTTISEKPLSPANFAPGFRSLLKTWESKEHVALRMAAQRIIRLGVDEGIAAVEKIMAIKSIVPKASLILSNGYRLKGELVEAEKALLGGLKRFPKNISLLIALGDLYMRTSMPEMASRIFKSARAVLGNHPMIEKDLIQAAIASDQLGTAIDGITGLIKRGYEPEKMKRSLLPLLMAEGRLAEAKTLLEENDAGLAAIDQSWRGESGEDSGHSFRSNNLGNAG